MEIKKESLHEARYKLKSRYQNYNIFFCYQSEAKRQRERRLKLKKGISQVCGENKEAASLLRSFNGKEHERPRIEYDQPELLSTIVKIVEASSAIDDRRRMECLRSGNLR